MTSKERLQPSRITVLCMALCSISLSTAITWLSFLFLTSSNIFSLTNFKDRAIGITILSGVDASMRTKIYVGLVLLSLCSFLLTYGLLLWARARYVKPEAEKAFQWLTAGTGVLILSASVIWAFVWLIQLAGKAPSVSFLSGWVSALIPAAVLVIVLAIYYLLSREDGGRLIPKGPDFTLLFMLTIMAASVALLYWLSWSEHLLVSLKFLTILWLLTGTLILTKNRAPAGLRNFFGEQLNNAPVLAAVMITALASFFVMATIGGGIYALTDSFFVLYPLLCIVFLAAYCAISRVVAKPGDQQAALDRAFVVACVPLAIIPLLIPLINELQYALVSHIYLPITELESLLMAGIIVIGIICGYLTLKGKIPGLSLSGVVENLYLPALVAAAALFTYHLQFLSIPAYDTFHHGEMLLTTQQLFSYGSIPFINSYPTHGLSDTSYQVLYTLINGYQPVAPLLWSWIPPVISVVLLYFLLKEIAGASFSFLAILFLPVIGAFGNLHSMDLYYYALAILPAILLVRILEKQTYGRFILYWLTIIFLALWRVDFGITAIVCSIFVIFIRMMSSQKLSLRESLAKFRMPAVTFGLVFVIAAIAFLALALLGHASLPAIVAQNLEFLSYQDATMSYVDILAYISPLMLGLAMAEYVLLPAISLVLIALVTADAIFHKKTPTRIALILVFLAIFSLICSTRSMGRHSLLETYNAYLFIFIALCLPFLLGWLDKRVATALFICMLTAYVGVFVIFYTDIGDVMVKKTIAPDQSGNYFELHNWQQKDRRIVDNGAAYSGISRFLSNSMNGSQTFFDFSNSPMLYVFTDKKDLTYIIPDMYLTSDTVQIQTLNVLENAYARGELPIVVFKQGNFWDYVDGVPNEIRSYRISEFIYSHYHPAGNVGIYQIWVANDYAPATSLLNSSTFEQPLSLRANASNSYDITLLSQDPILMGCGNTDPQIYGFADLRNVSHDPAMNNSFLKIECKSSLPGDVQIFYSFAGEPFTESMTSHITVAGSNATSVVYVPLPVVQKNLSDIRIDPPGNSVFEIGSVTYVETTGDLVPSEALVQNFDLKSLPYIWGTYDSKNAATATQVLYTVSDQNTLVGPECASFTVSSNIDKSTGNYVHFRIKSDRQTKVYMSYGNSTVDSISFDVRPSEDYGDYLVRVSTQWVWMNETITSMSIKADDPVSIGSISIRKGD